MWASERDRNAPPRCQLGADPGDLDLEMPLSTPRALTRSSTLRVEVPCHRPPSPPPAAPGRSATRLQQRREERALRSLGCAARHHRPWSTATALGSRCVRAALLAPLIGLSADVLGGLGSISACSTSASLRGRLQITAAACIQQLGQGRLAEGHRGELLGVNLVGHTELHAMALALLLSRARTPQSPQTTRATGFVRFASFAGGAWIARLCSARRCPEPPLVIPKACPADSCSRPGVDPEVVT